MEQQTIDRTAEQSTMSYPWGRRVTLTPEELKEVQALLADLRKTYDHVEDPDFHRQAPVLAHMLPLRIRKALTDFKLFEPQGALLLVDGYPMDDLKIGPTPPHWEGYQERNSVMEEEMFLVLMGALLGTPIGWSTQQDGRIVHDIAPIEANKDEQLGSGSETLLWWHTEDAFHPYRGDYLGLLCVRNPTGVPTTFASVEDLGLSQEHVDLLFEEHYTIRPDESHLVKNKAQDCTVEGELADSYDEIDRMNTRPDKISVFFGRRDAPYMRLDPYFMDPVEDPKAQEALDALCAAIDKKMEGLVLEPGTFLFLDNYQAVHGRKPFKARFDGTDRWLKRVNIVRDLRKSRDLRDVPESLIMQ